MKRVIIAVITDLNTDQRVQRISETLSENGFDVLLFGRENSKSKPINVKCKATRCKLIAERGMLMYLMFNWRLFWFLLFHKFDFVVSNDLDSLLGSSIASILKHKPLVYDSHEYFTELPELIGRPLKRKLWLIIERVFVPRAIATYTVCQSLANIYSVKYNKNFAVVRNVPYYIENPNHKSSNKIIIYQGALNVGRGIELMISAMRYLPDFELWIAGSGDVENELKKQAMAQNEGGKIVFLGRLAPTDLQQITQQALIGLSIEEDLGLNYHYALPNKVFDYIQARIPIIVSELPEMQQIVDIYKVGEVLKKRTPIDLANTIKIVINNYNTYLKNLENAASELNWEKEKRKLLKIYEIIDNH